MVGFFLLYDLYLNFSIEAFVFFSIIVSKGISFLFILTYWDRLFAVVEVFLFFYCISLLIYFSNNELLVFDFLSTEQLENKSSAYCAYSWAQLKILPYFLFLSSLKTYPSLIVFGRWAFVYLTFFMALSLEVSFLKGY